MGLGGSVASRALINAVLGVALAPVWSAAAAMLCMMLGSIGMRALSGRVIAKISVKVKNELEADVFEQIIGADWMALSPYRSGELLNRLHEDTRTVAGSIIGFIPSFLAGLVQFLGALAIMLYYDASMAAIALIGVPATAILSRALVKRMRRYNAEMRRIDGEMMAFQDEAFSNLQVIKSFGITDLFNSRMREMQDKYRDTYLAYNCA